jgi:hypothetical protein
MVITFIPEWGWTLAGLFMTSSSAAVRVDSDLVASGNALVISNYPRLQNPGQFQGHPCLDVQTYHAAGFRHDQLHHGAFLATSGVLLQGPEVRR